MSCLAQCKYARAKLYTMKEGKKKTQDVKFLSFHLGTLKISGLIFKRTEHSSPTTMKRKSGVLHTWKTDNVLKCSITSLNQTASEECVAPHSSYWFEKDAQKFGMSSPKFLQRMGLNLT